MKHQTHPVNFPLDSTYLAMALALDRLPPRLEAPIEKARRAAEVIASQIGEPLEVFLEDLMPWHISSRISELLEVGEISKAQALFEKEEALVLLPVARLAIDRENHK